MLIKSSGNTMAPESIVCVHLLESAGRAYYPRPRPEGEEGAPDMICEDCLGLVEDDRIVDYLAVVCMDCARAVQERHYCGACEFQEGPCEYHKWLNAL